MGAGRLCLFLLAVDLGLTTGLALFGTDGRLRWHRSQHFANATALRQAIHRILGEIPGLAQICVEGGGNLLSAWTHEAKKRGIGLGSPTPLCQTRLRHRS